MWIGFRTAHGGAGQSVPELAGDGLLQRLDFFIDELDDFSGIDINEVVVMGALDLLVASPPVTEVVLLQDPCLLEQADGSIYGRQTDASLDPRRPAVDIFCRRVVVRISQHLHDDPALRGHLESFLSAELFQV